MRYKLIISSNVPPGPIHKQVLFVGRDAAQNGYGGPRVETWIEKYCPPENLEEVRCSFKNDDSAYLAEDPFASRIYKVHPDTYAANPKMIHEKVDPFEEKTIRLTNGCMYSFNIPMQVKKI